jgi:hypothetical protein
MGNLANPLAINQANGATINAINARTTSAIPQAILRGEE